MMARTVRPESAHSLAHALEMQGETDEAIAVFRELTRLSPSSARHFVCLGKTLRSRGLVREANEVLDSGIAAGRQAVRLRPDDAFDHNVLATALSQRGRLDEAVTVLREAIRLRPRYASAHHNLGIALNRLGRTDLAIAEFRAAIHHEPDNHMYHSSLGSALGDLGRRDEAITELRETVRLKPDEAVAHYNVGVALFHQGRVDDALAEYRETIRLDPGHAEAHYNLANTLQKKGNVDLAITEYREAIRLKPDLAEAHCNLANQLKGQGRYTESLAEFERGHELGSTRADWKYPSAKWIEQARRLVRIEREFPALLRGDARPASITERLDFAHVAHTRGLHATSARLWAEAFALQPKLASEPMTRLRYAATRCAVLAGCGKGKEEPPLGGWPGQPYAAKPTNGSRPICRRGQRSWRMAHSRSGRLSSERSSRGKPMPTWPTSAIPMRWPRCPRPSGPTGATSGPRWTNC